MKNLTITKLSPNEWSAYRALRLEAVQTDPWAFSRSYQEELELPDSEWRKRLESAQEPTGNPMLFAKDGDNLVGMVGALVGTGERTRHVAKVVSVYVTPIYRGKGIATKLMEALLDELKKNPNILKVTLQASQEAVGVYKRVGFEELCMLKKEHCVDGVYYDEVIMEQFIKL